MQNDVHIYRQSEAIAVYEGLELIMYYKTFYYLLKPNIMRMRSVELEVCNCNLTIHFI